jgi:hypothetical protein
MASDQSASARDPEARLKALVAAGTLHDLDEVAAALAEDVQDYARPRTALVVTPAGAAALAKPVAQRIVAATDAEGIRLEDPCMRKDAAMHKVTGINSLAAGARVDDEDLPLK